MSGLCLRDIFVKHRVTKLRLKTVQNFVMHFKTEMRKIIEKKGDWSNL
jgi:hypothetical protein